MNIHKLKKLQFLIPILYILLIGLFFSCKSREKKEVQTVTDSDSLMVSIHRNPCFGVCPYYEAKIFSGGYILYEGFGHTDKIGLYSSHLDKKVLSQIIDEAKKIKYEALRDSFYNPGIADFPNVITSVKLNGKQKTIFNGTPDTPEELRTFEKFLDSVFANPDLKWRLIRKEKGDD